MPIIEPLKVKYQLSEDGKTIMLLSPDDPKAESAEKGTIAFDFDTDRIAGGGPALITFSPGLNSNDYIQIRYITGQLHQDNTQSLEDGFVKSKEVGGKHAEFALGKHPDKELGDFEHLRFANKKAFNFVKDYLKGASFLEYYQVSKVKPDPAKMRYEFLKMTKSGMEKQESSVNNTEQFRKVLVDHGMALDEIKYEIIQVLEKEYMAKPVKKDTPVKKDAPLKARVTKDNIIELSKRDQTTQSVFMQIINWIMDKVKGVSEFEVSIVIQEPSEELATRYYDAKIMLSNAKGQYIIDGPLTHDKGLQSDYAFILRGSAEEIQDFANKVAALDPKDIAQSYIGGDTGAHNVGPQKVAFDTALEAAELLQSELAESLGLIKEIQEAEEEAKKDEPVELDFIEEEKEGKFRSLFSSKSKKFSQSFLNEAQEENKEKGGGGATLTR